MEPINIVEKPWGKEEILESTSEYLVKRLTMNEGCRCSLQYHEYKTETIYVLKGHLYLYVRERDEEEFLYLVAVSGTWITIPAFVIHRMAAEDEEVVYLEMSSPYPDDVIRLEDDYARI